MTPLPRVAQAGFAGGERGRGGEVERGRGESFRTHHAAQQIICTCVGMWGGPSEAFGSCCETGCDESVRAPKALVTQPSGPHPLSETLFFYKSCLSPIETLPNLWHWASMPSPVETLSDLRHLENA